MTVRTSAARQAATWTSPSWRGAGRCRARRGFTLDKRTQQHPNELAVGVRLLYHFQASAPIAFFNMQTSQYSVMCFAPSEFRDIT